MPIGMPLLSRESRVFHCPHTVPTCLAGLKYVYDPCGSSFTSIIRSCRWVFPGPLTLTGYQERLSGASVHWGTQDTQPGRKYRAMNEPSSGPCDGKCGIIPKKHGEMISQQAGARWIWLGCCCPVSARPVAKREICDAEHLAVRWFCRIVSHDRRRATSALLFIAPTWKPGTPRKFLEENHFLAPLLSSTQLFLLIFFFVVQQLSGRQSPLTPTFNSISINKLINLEPPGP